MLALGLSVVKLDRQSIRLGWPSQFCLKFGPIGSLGSFPNGTYCNGGNE